MRRYTTPTLRMSVPGDITEADIRVTITQGPRKLIKRGPEVTATYDAEADRTNLSVRLTQEETGSFVAKKEATVQVNWIYEDGNRQATAERTINVHENLLNEVIEHGEN